MTGDYCLVFGSISELQYDRWWHLANEQPHYAELSGDPLWLVDPWFSPLRVWEREYRTTSEPTTIAVPDASQQMVSALQRISA